MHRPLELQPGGGPAYGRDHPLDADLAVVNESSMMDVILAGKLVKAIPAGAHLLLAGDAASSPRPAPAKYCRTCSRPAPSRGCA